MKTCASCGAALSATGKFCGRCGTLRGRAEAPPHALRNSEPTIASPPSTLPSAASAVRAPSTRPAPSGRSANAKWFGAVVAVSLLLLVFSSGGKDFIRGLIIGVSGQSDKSVKNLGGIAVPAAGTGALVFLHQYVPGDQWSYKITGRGYDKSGAAVEFSGTMTESIQSATFQGQVCLADVMVLAFTRDDGVKFDDTHNTYFVQPIGDYQELGIYEKEGNETRVFRQPFTTQAISWSPPHDFESAPVLTDGRVEHISQHTEAGPKTISWHTMNFTDCWVIKHYESFNEDETSSLQLFCPLIGKPFTRDVVITDHGKPLANMQEELIDYDVTSSDGAKSHG